MLYPELLDQERVVRFIVNYVDRSTAAEPLRRGRTWLRLGDRILELAETGGEVTPVTPLLVTMFVDSAIGLAQAGLSLDKLPQNVPEIFNDYIKRVCAGPGNPAVDEYLRAARVMAQASLGVRLVPSDFSPDDAVSALGKAGLGDRATGLLDRMISGGVIERRTFGGIALLRFALDPVAEFLTAIHFVAELRQLGSAELEGRVNALKGTDGYPTACDGYLKAFATCYRAYRKAFRLPDRTFPWEVGEEPAAA
jgi:hypothetical protein